MVNTTNYFIEKKQWSEIKDNLLKCYMVPYFAKIFNTGTPLTYIDAFAGAGYFDDDKKGSPLIVLDILTSQTISKKAKNTDVQMYFIEPKHFQELEKNISDIYPNESAIIMQGKFIDKIDDILECSKTRNLFLYVDPFGVKDLSFELFKKLSEHNKSIELLINFNSYGFLRWAFQVMKAPTNIIKDIDEYIDDDMKENYNIEPEIKLNNIVGGNYWKQIVHDKINNMISMNEAEKRLSEQFRNRLSSHFKYVIDLPIKNKKNNAPKYRMIHVTNHEDGCYLMYENISNRWDELTLLQSSGQFSLLERSHSEYHCTDAEIEGKFLEHIRSLPEGANINEIYATFCTQNGIFCKLEKLRNMIKIFENNSQIKLRRDPEFTATKKLSRFYSSSSKNKIWLIK